MDISKVITEDERTGALKLVRAKQKRDIDDERQESAVRRGVIRFMVVIIDCSAVMNERDMRPTRLGVVEQVVSALVDDYFDQNPISQLALVDLRDGQAEKISELSGNARHHKTKLEERMKAKRALGSGQPSIRAGLELAASMLEIQASYGTREVLLVYGSLSTCDRGDVFQTVARLSSLGVRVNVVGIAAELYVAKAISTETGGSYTVATQAMMLKEMVLAHVSPPPVLEEVVEGRVRKKPAAGMWVGFPTRREGVLPGWKCPRCHSLAPSVPSDCGVCGLKLLSSSHLARSYHHLFPVPSFQEVARGSGERAEEEGGGVAAGGVQCEGCAQSLGAAEERVQCAACRSAFCALCDGYIHQMLHVCPGCQRARPPAARAPVDPDGRDSS